jgi:hypothetical protein
MSGDPLGGRNTRAKDVMGQMIGYVALVVRDYDEAMRSRGLAFEEEPRDEVYGTVAVFRDLYGNRWDLLQPTAI